MELVGVRRRHGPGGVRWLVTVLVPEAVPGRRFITYEYALCLTMAVYVLGSEQKGSQLPLHAHLKWQCEAASVHAPAPLVLALTLTLPKLLPSTCGAGCWERRGRRCAL